MKNKRLMVLAISIIVLVALPALLWAALPRTPVTKLSRKVPVPATFTSAVAYGRNQLLYFNGHGFVAYNYVSGQSDPIGATITSDKFLPVDSISTSADQSRVLFHAEQAPSGSILISQLQKQGLSETGDYWWLYSQKPDAFLALPPGTLLVKLSGDSLYALSKKDDAELITIYDFNLREQRQIPIPNSSDFFALKDTLLLQTAGGSILSTQDGAVSHVLYDKTSISAVLGSEEVWATRSQGSSRQLVTLDLQGNTHKPLARDISGQPVWFKSSHMLYGVGKANSPAAITFYLYDAATGHKQKLLLPGDSKKSDLNPLALVGPNTILVTDNSGRLYLVGAQLSKLSP